jgi:hypothetical protein
MNTKMTSLLTYLLIGSVLGLALVSCNHSKTAGYNSSDSTKSNCECEASWFPHSQTPAPSEGDGSPFDTTSTTNAIFHQWSWQKFLWLTKPQANGKALFEDSLTLVDNNMEPVPAIGNESLVLVDTTQAGSGGMLSSNAEFSDVKLSGLVYYSIYANNTLAASAKGFKDFISKTPSKINNNFTFPVGALELKVSWIDIAAIKKDDLKKYYTTSAVIKSTGKKITVAMLGMHVVGVVKNHPEFIWATFEHKAMAPNYDWAASTDSTDAVVTSNSNQLFFQKGAKAGYNDINWPFGDSTRQAKNVFTLYTLGVPRIAGNKFMATSQSEPINYKNIESINACVDKSLDDVWKNYFYNGSIWLNTDGLSAQQQADTLVALGKSGNTGNAAPGSMARGSMAVFNLTMETYVQSDTTFHNMKVTDLTNCFSCHSSSAKIAINNLPATRAYSPLYLSHIFRSYLSKSSGLPISKIETLRTQEFLLTFPNKKK